LRYIDTALVNVLKNKERIAVVALDAARGFGQ
jgi:hypothetical protein